VKQLYRDGAFSQGRRRSGETPWTGWNRKRAANLPRHQKEAPTEISKKRLEIKGRKKLLASQQGGKDFWKKTLMGVIARGL